MDVNTEVHQAKLLPGGGLYMPPPMQVVGPPNCTRVVVFEWPHPHYAERSHRGIAHVFCNGEGNPPNSAYYFKKWCAFHARYHIYLELHENFRPNNMQEAAAAAANGNGGGLFLPLAPIGQPPPVPPAQGGQANGVIHQCIGTINHMDASFFWDDGAHHGN